MIFLGICYIIGAGDCEKLDFRKQKGDFVICADGGLAFAQKFNVEPDIIVGDFDSYGLVPKGEDVIVLPREKDKTDTHFALDLGIQHGFKEFKLYGMLGGRIDHSFANIQLLSYALSCGVKAMLVGDKYDVLALQNSEISFSGKEGKYVSVFSYSKKSLGIYIKGLKYEVDNFILTYDNPMGVSNEFTNKDAYIKVQNGTIIIMIEK